ILAGDRRVLFTIVPEGASAGARVAILDIEAPGNVQTVLEGAAGARYVQTGPLLDSPGSALRAVRFDATAGRTIGEPVMIPNVTVATSGDNGAAEFAVSDTGTLFSFHPFRPGRPQD